MKLNSNDQAGCIYMYLIHLNDRLEKKSGALSVAYLCIDSLSEMICLDFSLIKDSKIKL